MLEEAKADDGLVTTWSPVGFACQLSERESLDWFESSLMSDKESSSDSTDGPRGVTGSRLVQEFQRSSEVEGGAIVEVGGW